MPALENFKMIAMPHFESLCWMLLESAVLVESRCGHPPMDGSGVAFYGGPLVRYKYSGWRRLGVEEA